MSRKSFLKNNLLQINNQWQLQEKLGAGSFGSVYQGTTLYLYELLATDLLR